MKIKYIKVWKQDRKAEEITKKEAIKTIGRDYINAEHILINAHRLFGGVISTTFSNIYIARTEEQYNEIMKGE